MTWVGEMEITPSLQNMFLRWVTTCAVMGSKVGARDNHLYETRYDTQQSNNEIIMLI